MQCSVEALVWTVHLSAMLNQKLSDTEMTVHDGKHQRGSTSTQQQLQLQSM